MLRVGCGRRGSYGLGAEVELAVERVRDVATLTKDGDSFAEGIGQTRVTENLEGIVIDDAYRVTDQLALSIVYQLMREEGLFVGLSSGINVAGALRLAREGGPGQVIVTLLCDSGIRYMSKTFNPEWLVAHGLDPNEPISQIA